MLKRNLFQLLQGRWCVTNNIIKLFKQLADCLWLWGFCSHSSCHCEWHCSHVPSSHDGLCELKWFLQNYFIFTDAEVGETIKPHAKKNTDTREKKEEKKEKLNLRWMARSRGMSVGLLGGEELVLWRLRLLSMEGDACTVILCWKSAKGIKDSYNLRSVTIWEITHLHVSLNVWHNAM